MATDRTVLIDLEDGPVSREELRLRADYRYLYVMDSPGDLVIFPDPASDGIPLDRQMEVDFGCEFAPRDMLYSHGAGAGIVRLLFTREMRLGFSGRGAAVGRTETMMELTVNGFGAPSQGLRDLRSHTTIPLGAGSSGAVVQRLGLRSGLWGMHNEAQPGDTSHIRGLPTALGIFQAPSFLGPDDSVPWNGDDVLYRMTDHLWAPREATGWSAWGLGRVTAFFSDFPTSLNHYWIGFQFGDGTDDRVGIWWDSATLFEQAIEIPNPDQIHAHSIVWGLQAGEPVWWFEVDGVVVAELDPTTITIPAEPPEVLPPQWMAHGGAVERKIAGILGDGFSFTRTVG